MAHSPSYRDLERAREAQDVSSLIDILDRAPTTIRVAAARHLGELGARDAVSSLIRAARSPDLILRVACLKALGAIGDVRAADAIAAVAADDNQLAIQTTAAIALLGLDSPHAVDVLIAVALRKETTARHSRRWAIRRLADSQTVLAGDVLDKIAAQLSAIDRLRLRRPIAVLRAAR